MSLISTYQSRKSLFAEKLITKGVEASATDGLTTLINKIDDIPSEGFTDGLLLYADKKIAQSEDTVNLYALLLEDNVAVSGEKVKIYSDIYLRSETCSSTDSLYDDYYASSSKSGLAQYDFIGDGSPYIRYNSTTINIFYGGQQWSSDFRYTGEFHIKDGVLTYKDSQEVSHTVDVSMVDTTKVPSNPITVHYKWVEVTTDSDGVASYEYDCTGSGLREFYATYGSIVSETYEVLDCGFYEQGTTGTPNTDWKNYNNRLTITPSNDGILLEAPSNASGYYIANKVGTSGSSDKDWDAPFGIEFTVVSISSEEVFVGFEDSAEYNIPLSTYNIQDGDNVKILYDGEDFSISVNGGTPATRSKTLTTSNIYLKLNKDKSLKFKEFMIYPI